MLQHLLDWNLSAPATQAEWHASSDAETFCDSRGYLHRSGCVLISTSAVHGVKRCGRLDDVDLATVKQDHWATYVKMSIEGGPAKDCTSAGRQYSIGIN